MPYIQLNDLQYPLRVGELRVGSGPDADIQLPNGAGTPATSMVTLSDDGHVSIRRLASTAIVRVNGVALGVEPTPLIHGDKIEVEGMEMLFGDDRKGGSTQFISSMNVPDLTKRRGPQKPTAATGGRLVSLVDGREYTVPASGLVLGRDASCDVVVPSPEVSRRHAEIVAGPDGYVVSDMSTNGVNVNGERIDRSQVLGRGDVLRVGNEEFRFYADQAAAAPAAAVAPAPAPVAPPPAPAAPRPAPPSAPPSAPIAAAASAAAAPASAAAAAPRPVAASGGEGPPGTGTPRPLLATLEIINEGVLKGKRFEIRSPLSHVGRGAHNDLVISDDSVSDSHAKIQKRDAGWFVVDMGSTNGTYVGGKRIENEAKLVGAPDVRFGGIKMTFRPVAEAADEAKGTRAFAGPDVKRAPAIPPTNAPVIPPVAAPIRHLAPEPAGKSSGGMPAWIWIAAIVVLAAVAFFILKGR